MGKWVVVVVVLVVIVVLLAAIFATLKPPPLSPPVPPVDVFGETAPSESESPLALLPVSAAGKPRVALQSSINETSEQAIATYRTGLDYQGDIEIKVTKWVNATLPLPYLTSVADRLQVQGGPRSRVVFSAGAPYWFTFTPSGDTIVPWGKFAWQRGIWTFEVTALGESVRNQVALEVASEHRPNLVVLVNTNFGSFTLELNATSARVTVTQFLSHVMAGDYDGTTIHRVAPDFVIQGGDLSAKGIHAAPVPWEDTGLANVRYTVAMARIGDPNSPADSGTARSQFFVNLQDNSAFLDSFVFPYVVFGQVIEGMDVVDAIGALPTNPPGDGAPTTPVTVLSMAEA